MEMSKFSRFLPLKNDLYILHVPRFFIFAAANAAATTRLSGGNEEVFRNFTPENDLFLPSIKVLKLSEIKNISQVQINLKLSGSQSI